MMGRLRQHSTFPILARPRCATIPTSATGLVIAVPAPSYLELFMQALQPIQAGARGMGFVIVTMAICAIMALR